MSSTTTTDLIRRALARETNGDRSAPVVAAAAETVCAQVIEGLSRWFGPYGSHALVARALASVQPRHPPLSGVTLTEGHRLQGLQSTGPRYDDEAVIEAVVAMMGAVGELLGRMIGDDLAASVLEQSITTIDSGDTDGPGDARNDAILKGPRTP